MKSIRHGLMAVAACALLLFITGAAVVVSVHRTNELADAQEFVGDKLFGARQVYETLMGMESSQRGYLLTRDPVYLEPYQRQKDTLDGIIGTFERLYRDDAEVRDLVRDIGRLAHDKETELARTVKLAQAGEFGDAMAVVGGNSGKQLMDQLGAKLLDLIARERAQRTGFVDEARKTLRYLYLLGAGIAILLLTLVSVAVRSLSLSIARLNDAQRAEEHNAMHDSLTGLPNRRYLSEWLATALAGAKRSGRELHVLYFDLDGFKAVNDRFGHDAGDRVLEVTAARLRHSLRESDFVARLGGDEFVAALADPEDAGAISALIERIEQQLNIAPIDELEDGVVTASIGRASYPRDGDTMTALLAAADKSMYNIKEMRRVGGSRGGRPPLSAGPFTRPQPA